MHQISEFSLTSRNWKILGTNSKERTEYLHYQSHNKTDPLYKQCLQRQCDRPRKLNSCSKCIRQHHEIAIITW